MRFVNWLFGLFGYEWIKESRPENTDREDSVEIVQGEDWEDVYETVPHYVLRKKSISGS